MASASSKVSSENVKYKKGSDPMPQMDEFEVLSFSAAEKNHSMKGATA